VTDAAVTDATEHGKFVNTANTQQLLQVRRPQALQAVELYKRSTGDKARNQANPVPFGTRLQPTVQYDSHDRAGHAKPRLV
jgi:hypothetical protein